MKSYKTEGMNFSRLSNLRKAIDVGKSMVHSGNWGQITVIRVKCIKGKKDEVEDRTRDRGLGQVQMLRGPRGKKSFILG
jgi:hypothetical protein